MPIKKKEPPVTDIVPVEGDILHINETTAVVDVLSSFANLDTARDALVGELRKGENAKVNAARIIDAIARQELYRERGFESFEAFIPALLEETERFGWKSKTSLKRYLAWFRLFIQTLNFNEKTALRAVSHLHALIVLADLDRKTGGFKEEEVKPGKLGPVAFEDITRLVTFLAAEESPAIRDGLNDGLTGAELADVLEAEGLTTQANTFVELMGRPIALPPGGWSLADTQEIIDVVKGQSEEETTKITRVWRGRRESETVVSIHSIVTFEGQSIIDVLEVDRNYTDELLAKVSKGATLEIEGETE